MVDWLRFEPADDVLYVHILVGRLIELQPGSIEETDEFCKELYPVLDKIQEICIEKNLKQVCSADLSGVRVASMNPISMMRIIWNVYDYTKDRLMLAGMHASGTDPFFKTLVDSVRGFLPPFMRSMISIT